MSSSGAVASTGLSGGGDSLISASSSVLDRESTGTGMAAAAAAATATAATGSVKSMSGPSGAGGAAQQPKKKKEDSVSTVPLTFPLLALVGDDLSQKHHHHHHPEPGGREQSHTTSTLYSEDPTSLLSTLKDEHSSHTVVTKTVLQICQFAGTAGHDGNYSNGNGNGNSTVVHDPTYAKICSNSIQALMECLKSHKDRRCRILSAKTLALLGKAAYARIRPSPMLYAVRDGTVVSRLEDEIGAELPTALVTAAIQEDDEGVSAAALEGLGILVTFHSGTPGVKWAEDLLSREILSMTAARVSPYAPTLKSLVEEDVSLACTELATRILDNVVQPRLFMLLERVCRYVTTACLALAMPVLTTAMIHQLQTAPSQVFGMNKTVYSKQWAQVDAMGGLVTNLMVQSLLLPLLQQQQTHDGHLAHAAALSALRLADAASVYNAQAAMPLWVTQVCRSVVTVQHEALTATPLSLHHKMILLATLIIAARAIPFPERTNILIGVVEPILGLPSTTRAPLGIGACPGLVMQDYANSKHNNNNNNRTDISFQLLQHKQVQFGRHFRRPARISYWTEVALSFFLDGPAPTTLDLKTVNSNKMGSGGNTAHDGTSVAAAPRRQEALRKFLSLPVITSVINDATMMSSSSSAAGKTSPPLTPREELLLAFTSVAIACGRRFRGGNVDPTSPNTQQSLWPITDPSALGVEEWLQLSWVVLTAFVPCVNMGRKYTYLEEDLSLGMAGLAQYVQLLQEYLHFAGLLHPGSSVALKLVANACPPHLLWDQLSESATFMSRFEALDMGLLEHTTKLMDDIVSREVKQGIPSHHMRLFLLALAADHWMQGRVAAIRKQFESPAAANFTPNLEVSSAREVILALSPKRILSKIFQHHVPPVDADGKKKKDPIKRLAQETVRVCVACIENIALIACDWRKRFTSSANNNPNQEPKHVVSVAVGVLQGKVDETPANDIIKSIMAPVCEAAVVRIQSFYESDMGGQDSFPASELVMQNVKTKIKPLVSSSSRPANVSTDDFARGYLMTLSRQLVMARVEQAIQCFPPADADLAPARASNWLRLQIPPISDPQDGRVLGNRGEITSTFGASANIVSAGADPIALALAYRPRRYFRHDGEEEYRIAAFMRVHNTTSIEFTEGVRLEIGLVNQQGDFHVDGKMHRDSLEHAVREALEMDIGGTLMPPLESASVVCKQELKPGEFLTWEIALDHACAGEGLALLPSVVFRNVPKESSEVGAKWVGEKSGGDASTINTGGESGGGEDDFQVTETDNTMTGMKDADTPSENVTLVGDALSLDPMFQLQPCPLVFLRNRWGDIDAFRFLWFRMPYHIPEIPLEKDEGQNGIVPQNRIINNLADMSCLVWNGEAIPGGYVTRAWAFATLSGQRILAVLSESDSDKQMSLFLRGDDPFVLYGLVGPPRNRLQVTAALAAGLTCEFD